MKEECVFVCEGACVGVFQFQVIYIHYLQKGQTEQIQSE